MLFNTDQYQQPFQQSYEGDWDVVKYDPAWDELDDIPEIPQDEVSTVVEVLEYDLVSVSNQFLGDKLSEDISSRKTGENEEFLKDKLGEHISSRKTSENQEFLEDKLGENISSRKTGENQKLLEDKLGKNISSRKMGKNEEFLEDKLGENISSKKTSENEEFLEDKSGENISSRKMGENEEFLEDKLGENISSRKTSENQEFLEDKSGENISSRKTRRRKGDGSGCIYYRTVAKKGKEYCEAYYQYEVWKDGDRLVKSSKYIPKRLLIQVQRLEVEKAPVKKTLGVLGINC